MNDERDDRLEEFREQEFLEEGQDPGGDSPDRSHPATDPDRRDRLARLDALLAEAVQEEWTPALTESVLARLDDERRALRSPATWLGGLLAAAAAVLLLASWGAVEGVARVPGWLADLPGRVAGDVISHVPAAGAEASAGALLLLFGTIAGGAFLARRSRGRGHA